MTKEQLEQVKSQNMASKNLQRNLIVNPNLMSLSKGVQNHLNNPSNNVSTSNSTNPQSNNNVPIISNEILFKNRENRIKEKIENRKNQIYTLPPDISDDQKVKAIIEYKQLQLLPLQRKLRGIIASSMHGESIISSISNDPTLFKKNKRNNLDGRNNYPLNDDSGDHPQKTVFIDAVLEHSRKFKEFHQSRTKQTNKILKQMERQI